MLSRKRCVLMSGSHERADDGREHGRQGWRASRCSINLGALRLCKRGCAVYSGPTGLDLTWHDPPETLLESFDFGKLHCQRGLRGAFSMFGDHRNAWTQFERACCPVSATHGECAALPVHLPVRVGGSSAEFLARGRRELSTRPCTTCGEHVEGDFDGWAFAHRL